MPRSGEHARALLEAFRNGEDASWLPPLLAPEYLAATSPTVVRQSVERVTRALGQFTVNRVVTSQAAERTRALLTSESDLLWVLDIETTEGFAGQIRRLHVEPVLPRPRLESLSELPRWMVAMHCPGVAVVTGNLSGHREVHCWGDADSSSPMRSDTFCQVGSLSKTVTALHVVDLSVQRRITLDVPVGEFLPSSYHRLALPLSATLAELVNHESGMSYVYYDGYSPRWQRSLPDLAASLAGGDEIASARPRLVAAPGCVQSYSGAGYTLLQLALYGPSPDSFAEALQRDLGWQLGHSVDKLAIGMARGAYATGSIGGRYLEYGPQAFPELAAAGLWANVDILGQLCLRLLESELLVSSATYAQTTRRFLGWGLQWRRRTEGWTAGYNGGTPGFSAIMQLRPSDGGYLAAVANSSDAQPLLAAIADYQFGAPAR